MSRPNDARPRCYFVVGQGGSGTRLVTRLIMSGGCFGDGGHEQQLDAFAEGPVGHARDVIIHRSWNASYDNGVVFRRSYPDHGGLTPNLRDLRHQFHNDGFDVFWVVVMRRASRFRDDTGALRQEGTPAIFHEIHGLGDEWCVFNTSVMFLDPEVSKLELGKLTGLEIGSAEEILNPDLKNADRVLS